MKQDALKQRQHQETLQQLARGQVELEELSNRLRDAKRGREGDDRPQKLLRLTEIAQATTELEREWQVLKENDPQALADLSHELKLCQQAAERWTDNVFLCREYMVKKRGMDKKEVNRMLGITAEFDCKCSTVQ